MSAVLSTLGLAWQLPVHGAQQTFRVLLAAMAHPGRVHRLPAAAIDGVEPPATGTGRPMSIAATASLLALLDAESSVHFSGAADTSALAGYFRFHCGVRAVALDDCQFVHARGLDADAELCRRMPQGSDAVPQDGATLVIEVDGLDDAAREETSALLRLQGPGIRTQAHLRVSGCAPSLWHWRARQLDALPRGIDLLLCCGDRLVAIPRSTALEPETPSCM